MDTRLYISDFDFESENSAKRPKDIGITSGIVRAAVMKPLYFWYKTPLKLFRPLRVDYLGVVKAIIPAKERVGYRTSFGMISAAVKYGGFDIIHRYVLPPLLANTAVGISLFTVYTATLLSLDPDSGLNPSGYKTFSNAFTAGALAGAVSSTIATPLDSIQARFHVQEMIDGKFKSVMAYTKSMVQELGVATLYRGLGLTLVKDALGYGIFFGVFELAKKQGYKMAVEHANRDRDLADVNSQLVKPKFWVQPLLVLGSGALAAIFYQAVDHPFEQIRKVFFVKASQAEIRYRTRTTYVETIRECIRLGNKKGYQQFLFKGVVTNALRAVPASSLGLLCFEYLRNEFEHDLELMSKP